MTPEYILRKSLCRKPYCAHEDNWRAMALSFIENLEYAHEYAEPRYDNPKKAILFSNWNYFPSKVTDLLEKYGYSIEWEDEWTRCDVCQKALRTSPDSYSWQPNYIDTENGYFCKDCLDEDCFEELEDNPRRAININGIKLEDYGYEEIKCGYENGLHEGMNDDPKKIYSQLKAEGHKRILFQVDHTSQFYITFCVWKKKEESDEQKN